METALETTLKFVIASEYPEGRRVQDRILDELVRRQYDPAATFAIRIALEEALINAIKHGNQFDKSKKVRVRAKISDEQADISVEDQGPGFNRASVPDPTAQENLERLHGRGILLMEAYMDRVQWSRGGRRVRLIRRNTGDSHGIAACS